MKRMVVGAALLAAAPFAAQAQSLQPGGAYVGLEGGLNWLFNTTFNTQAVVAPFFNQGFQTNASFQTGYVLGGTVGYDFVGPRVELEGSYRDNWGTLNLSGFGASANVHNQTIAVMGNVYYDFLAGSRFVPYIGAGAGVAFLQAGALGTNQSATTFAFQGMIGAGYNIDETFRINLEGRYFGTTTPNYTYASSVGGFGYSVTASPSNNNVSLMASLQMRFNAPPAPPPPPPAAAPVAPSFMVFFDWDRSNLSQQALATIGQAAQVFKTKGNARITATGHTDTSGPEAYNMALSLRRANAVKDALVRNGVPAQAITVIGRGEQGLLVPTADGVREPQNRRVEIVIQ
jgi:OmpA-OmpF porin, OOP family